MTYKFNPFTGNLDGEPDVSGKVDGAASSTDNAVARFDGVTGKVIQNSGVTIDDSNNVIVPGNLTINGTTTFINTTNLNITDKNITVNNSGSDASAEGAGITVDRVSTDGSIAFDSSLASKWKAGLVGSEVQLADVSSTQTLTNKSIDADQNTITNIEDADIKTGAAINATKIAGGTVSNTEFGYLDGVTSAIQTQFTGKQSTTLTDSHILVGNVSNVATDVAVTGDVVISNAGVTAISSNVIVNADVNSAAAIARSKLASGSGFRVVTNDTSGVMTDAAAITASRALVSDTNGIPTHSTVTTTELGYVSGVTSAIQTQLGAKQSTTLTNAHILVGNVSNVATDVAVTGDVTISNAGVTDISAGVIVNNDVNASAAIARSKLASGSAFRVVTNDTSGVMTDAAAITASRALVSDTNGIPTHSTVTTTELGYVSGVTSAIQTQLGAKVSTTLTDSQILVGNASNVATAVAVTGDVTITNAGVTAIGAEKVTNAQMAQMIASRIKGRIGSTGTPADLTPTQVTAILNVFGADAGAGGVKGLVPSTVAGDAAKYLKGDGSWSSITTGSYAVTSVSANTTLTTANQVVAASASGGAITITLYTAVGNTGREIVIYKSDTSKNAVTVDANASETIGAPGTLTYLLTAQGNQINLVSDGANWIVRAKGDTMTAIIFEQQASGTGGGTFTSGSWATRTLNTTSADTSFITLASNQVTLSPGRYIIQTYSPAYQVARHRCRFRNITDSTSLAYSMAVYADTGTGSASIAIGHDYTSLTAAKVFELQAQCESTKATNGFGVATSFMSSPEPEVFGMVVITKLT